MGKLWNVLTKNQRNFWTATWFIIVFALLLISNIWASAYGQIRFAPAFLWSCAYLMVGVVVGFIFAIPTIISNSRPGTIPANATEGNKKVVQANTNLTQISDWFTKVIVGAGLVQLSKIPGFIKDRAKEMGKGLQVSISETDQAFAAVFSGGIIVAFLTFGFVCGYLIMRIVLTEIFADTENG